MPPTPFIGISLLVHVCIILIHKIFHWVPRKRIIHKKVTFTASLLSFFIVVSVFLFMLTSAVVLVYASAQNEYSIFKTISW